MLVLGSDVILHHIVQQLPLQDLLSLRATCKRLRSIIDTKEWDRRYFHEFPFDSRRLSGHGLARYKKRFSATAGCMGSFDRHGNWNADKSFDNSFEYFKNRPIVDLQVVELQSACGDFDYGIAARLLDNNVYVHVASGVNAILHSAGFSGVHISDDRVTAFKDGIPVVCDLTEAFWDDDFDENGQEDLRSRNMKELVMEEHTPSTANDPIFDQLGNSPGTSLGSPLGFSTRLYASHPSLTYLWNVEMHSRDLHVQDKVASLIALAGVPLATLWFRFVHDPVYIVAGSSSNTLYVILGNKEIQESRKYTLPHKITKIAGFCYYREQGQVCDINLLDCKGCLYRCRYFGNQSAHAPNGPVDTADAGEWRGPNTYDYTLEEVEPVKVMDQVADLADTSVLMQDGTIKTFHGFTKQWHDLSVSNAVLITDYVYLAV